MPANSLEVLRRGAVTDGAGMIPLELSAEGKQGTAWLIWPAAKPSDVAGSPTAKSLDEPKPESEPGPTSTPQSAAAAEAKPESLPEPSRGRGQVPDLPDYTRSLLKIKVPVVVTLAHERQPLARIVELGPGSIIQFEKSCEEMLEMDVGSCQVANGEAVKIGDKFGLRVTSIVLPEERFHAVKPAHASKSLVEKGSRSG